MTLRPKISVLIPTYRYAAFLPAAVDSVLAQDFSDFELLISDDTSDDGSADVIRSFASRDPRIRFRIQPTNLGMVGNWNWCLSEARGDQVKFVFGDDLLVSPRALGRLSEALDAEPRAVLAVSARKIIDEASRPLGVWSDLGAGGFHGGADVFLDCLRRDRNLIGEPSAVLFRRAAAARGFDPAFRQLVDQEFWFHLLRGGGLWYDPEPLCAFRRHRSQQTAVNQLSRVASAESLRLVARYLDEFAAAAGLRPDAFAMRRILFRCAYYARKHAGGAPVAGEEAAIRRWLPARAYRAHWFLHRLAKPVVNLRRFIARPPPRPGELPDPPRMLVIRRRYLGDIVLLGSLLRNLRLHWPGARLGVLLDRGYADVLALNPDVDRIFAMPRRLSEWPRMLLDLRRERFTHVFNLDNTERTALAARLTGAAFRLGLHHSGYRLKLRAAYTHVAHHPDAEHEGNSISEYYLQALGPAGVPIATREVRLVPRESDLADLRRYVGAGGRAVLAVHPGSRSPWRIWPAERFAAVCDVAQEELDAQVVLVGGPGDDALLGEIRKNARTHLFALPGPLSLPRFAALARLSAAVLCHDSGPMHVAAAVGTPVIALYGSQNAVLFRPSGEGHSILQAPLPCTECLAPEKCVPADSYRNLCVRRLSVDTVTAAVRAQLAKARGGP